MSRYVGASSTTSRWYNSAQLMPKPAPASTPCGDSRKCVRTGVLTSETPARTVRMAEVLAWNTRPVDLRVDGWKQQRQEGLEVYVQRFFPGTVVIGGHGGISRGTFAAPPEHHVRAAAARKSRDSYRPRTGIFPRGR